MSSPEPSGLLNYSKLDQEGQSYVMKLLVTIIAGIFAGIMTGIVYNSRKDWTGFLGFGIFILVQGILVMYVEYSYDLPEWDNKRIFRHGIVVSFFMYLFFWIVIFQFMIDLPI